MLFGLHHGDIDERPPRGKPSGNRFHDLDGP
jgi:hypothetical protein